MPTERRLGSELLATKPDEAEPIFAGGIQKPRGQDPQAEATRSQQAQQLMAMLKQMLSKKEYQPKSGGGSAKPTGGGPQDTGTTSPDVSGAYYWG